MSEKKNIFLLIFDWIVNCYDNSFFEKVMKKIFGFFEKNIPGSGILGFFSRRDGSIWRKSRAAEIVRSPFSACRSFYRRNETKIENIKKQSGAYRFFKDAANISLRDFGVLALALAAGTAVGNTFFSMWSSAARRCGGYCICGNRSVFLHKRRSIFNACLGQCNNSLCKKDGIVLR